MARAGSTHSGGFVNAGGWGTRKNSVPIPRGVHAARQKHAPCVEKGQDCRTITTHMFNIYVFYLLLTSFIVNNSFFDS